jgi:PST family polysaccharide transporter
LKSDWFEWNYFIQPFDKIIAKKLGSYSIMAIVTALTIPVSQILLRRIIIDKLGIEASGYWQGINKISDGYLLLVTTSLNTYYLPKLSSIKNDGDIRKEIIKGYKVILPFTVITCLLIYFSRFFIITTLYTASFLQMEKLFIYQLIGDFFKIAAWILAYLMLAKAMTVVYILTEIVFSFTFIIISYYCMEYWKLEGITVAFLMNYVLYFFVMILVFRKILFKK